MARAGTGSSGVACASLGYFGIASIFHGTGAGTAVTSVTEARLTREVAGAPSIGYQVPAGTETYERRRGLPIPVGESVRLNFPSFAVTPRRVRFITWGPLQARAPS